MHFSATSFISRILGTCLYSYKSAGLSSPCLPVHGFIEIKIISGVGHAFQLHRINDPRRARPTYAIYSNASALSLSPVMKGSHIFTPFYHRSRPLAYNKESQNQTQGMP